MALCRGNRVAVVMNAKNYRQRRRRVTSRRQIAKPCRERERGDLRLITCGESHCLVSRNGRKKSLQNQDQSIDPGNLTQGRIAAAHGGLVVFAMWRMCTPTASVGSAILQGSPVCPTQTNTQTTERATCVAICRIYVMLAMRPKISIVYTAQSAVQRFIVLRTYQEVSCKQ